MAVTTKKQFAATTNATTTVFSPVSIQLNNQDDLDVYVTLSGGTRVLQLRQSTGSTAQSSHPQVNNTDGLYFPAVSAGTTLYNYTLSSDNNTITFNSALPSGAVVFCERRTRDADSSYTSFASGSTIRATDLNNSSTESNFTGQDARNKALTIEGVLFRGDQPSTNFVTTDHIVAGTIVTNDIANNSVNADKIADDVVNSEHYVAQSIDTEHIALENITTALIAGDAIVSSKLADNAVNSEHYVDGSIDHVHLANDAVDGDNISDDSINSEHYVDGSIDTQHIAADQITNALIADNQIDSEHYVDGSVDHVHLANDCIDGDNIQDDVVNSEHIAAGALDNEHYASGSITSDKLNAATVVTASEQASAASNDTSFLTTAASDARFFNVSTGDTIKDGDSFPDNDTTIATTAAINDRIIDLVDDVGGFVPIANETSFPNANPDVNNGTGTIVSVSTLSNSYTSDGSGTFTISNGTVGNSTVTINGAANSTTYSAGYGLLVETTTTLNTYTYHRLVPKPTEITTVAGKATEIGRLGTAAAVEDMSILGTTDVVADLNTLGTADVVSDLNTLGTADVVADMNTLAVTSVVNNMDTVATNVANVNLTAGSIANVNTTAGSIANVNTTAGSIANVNTTAGSISNVNIVGAAIANVNTTATNIADVNNFAGTYQIASSAPSTDGSGNALAEGDLYFDTASNELRVYNGSAWQGGVTAGSGFAGSGANNFTGDQTISNAHPKLIFNDTDSENDFHIANENGTLVVKDIDNNATRLAVNSDGHTDIKGNLDCEAGVDVTGNITVSGNVDGRDVAADGVKLDGIDTGAKDDQTASEIKTLLASDNITSTHIANDAVTGDELASNSVTSAHIVNGAITNTDINASAAIAGTKISPDFGSQNIVTTGNLQINSTLPQINLFDSNNDSDFSIENADGTWRVKDRTNALIRFSINSAGTGNFTGNLDVGAGVDVTGNITVTGTVDGVDLQTLNTAVSANTAKVTNATHTGDVTGSTSLTIANDAVTTAKIADDAITTAQIGNNAVSSGQINDNAVGSNQITSDAVVTSKIAAGAITNNRLADQAVTLDKIVHGTSSNNGKFLRANNGADPTFETVSTDLVADTSPQLGGDLDTNSNKITLPDSNGVTNSIVFGNSSDMKMYHNGTHSVIKDSGQGNLQLAGSIVQITNAAINASMLVATEGGSVELTHSGTKKFETTSDGITVTGSVTSSNFGSQGDYSGQLGRIRVGADTHGNTIRCVSDSNLNIAANSTVAFYIGGATDGTSFGTGIGLFYSGGLRPAANNTFDLGTSSYRWRNIYTNDLHLSNEGHSNEVDGTWGNWTIQEGESDLFLKNNRSGKKYKFNLTEVS